MPYAPGAMYLVPLHAKLVKPVVMFRCPVATTELTMITRLGDID